MFNILNKFKSAKCGITYVAWGPGIEEAENSAQTARKFGLNTCLIAPKYNGRVFDRFVKLDYPIKFPAQKVFVYHLSPWERTLYLDTDTIILSDLSFGFAMAQRYGLALSHAPACFVKLHWDLTDPELPQDLPEYNGGVIFFDRTHHQMKDFWLVFQEELNRKVNWDQQQGNPEYNDQSALSIFLYKKGINPYVLPPNWNFRPFRMHNGYGPLKIWHRRCAIPQGFDPQQKGWWALKPQFK